MTLGSVQRVPGPTCCWEDVIRVPGETLVLQKLDVLRSVGFGTEIFEHVSTIQNVLQRPATENVVFP